MAGSLKQDLSRSTGSRSAGYRAADRLHAVLAGLGPASTAFVSHPEPTSFGDPARGRQLLAGNHLINGEITSAPGLSLWDVAEGAPGLDAMMLHDFKWLDDLAALGTKPARALAQEWLSDWIARYGRGRGPGWTPDVTARRIMRWISHTVLLLGAEGSALAPRYFRSLSHQAVFLSRRWRTAASGRPRFEALCGMMYAGLSLSGFEDKVAAASKALDQACLREIDGQGALASRNPEDMLDVLSLLTWVADAVEARGQAPSLEQAKAITRMAPSLRALRHRDGTLLRGHGGGRGAPGHLEGTLARTGVAGLSEAPSVMGFARLAAAGTTVLVDAAPPPRGAAALSAHASTLAFEMTSGAHPLVVSCGPGSGFGPEWRRAARATASHSTLELDGLSSSRLITRARKPGEIEALAQVPTRVTVEIYDGPLGMSGRLMTHDGYDASHGLTHARQMELDGAGRVLSGTDTLAALSEGAHLRCDRAAAGTRGAGLPYSLRFHLAPEVEAEIDMGGTAVSLVAGEGEVWIFRAQGAELRLAPSVVLERDRLKPRATRQIVLSGHVQDYAVEIGWSFTRAT